MSSMAEMVNGIFHDSTGRRVRLRKQAAMEVIKAWTDWQEGVFNPYIEGRNTRSLYNEHNRRGKRLVEIQTKWGVWLIHPDNAKAGLKSDDSRIIG